MIQLETTTLPPGLIWRDRHAAQAVGQSVRRTLDGGLAVFYQARVGGLSITLESEPDQGWLTRTQVEAVKALADAPGAIYTLALDGQTLRVMFRHHEPPAFDAQPLYPGADWFTASLKLMTVEN
ncbi:MAG: hypothetical protein ACOZAP_04520 [Pseudomonadota bacterium]